jgi:hypothetical protein
MFDPVEGNSSNRATVGIGLLLLATGLILNYIFERHSFHVGDLLYPVLCFFLSLAGVFISVGGVARTSFRGLLPYAYATVLPLTILYFVFFYGIQFVQTGADRFGECTGLCQTVAASVVVPGSLSVPGRPAVFCSVERRGMFLSYYNQLTVYGVTDLAAQQKVLDGLTQHYRQAHTNPIQVMFYERENWTVRSGKSGVSSGARGPERLIRVATVG